MVSNNTFSLLLVCNLHLNEAKKHSKAIYAANINIKHFSLKETVWTLHKLSDWYFFKRKKMIFN